MSRSLTKSKPLAELIYVCDDRMPWKLKEIKTGTIVEERETELKLRRSSTIKNYEIQEKVIFKNTQPNLSYFLAHVSQS